MSGTCWLNGLVEYVCITHDAPALNVQAGEVEYGEREIICPYDASMEVGKSHHKRPVRTATN